MSNSSKMICNHGLCILLLISEYRNRIFTSKMSCRPQAPNQILKRICSWGIRVESASDSPQAFLSVHLPYKFTTTVDYLIVIEKCCHCFEISSQCFQTPSKGAFAGFYCNFISISTDVSDVLQSCYPFCLNQSFQSESPPFTMVPTLECMSHTVVLT